MEISTIPAFDKKYKKLPVLVKDKAKQKETLFRTNCFHPRLETHKLHGKDKDVWAFSVDRKYRIKFIFLSGEHVLFIDVGSHDIYQ